MVAVGIAAVRAEGFPAADPYKLKLPARNPKGALHPNRCRQITGSSFASFDGTIAMEPNISQHHWELGAGEEKW